MYLKRAIIENNGAIHRLNLPLGFNQDGTPKPLILVGANGGGKTNFLSIVTDALFEAAAVHYDDVLPHRGAGRSWLRTVGGRNVRVGAEGSVSILQFENSGQQIIYKEKAGSVDVEDLKSRVPSELHSEFTWGAADSIKTIGIEDAKSQTLFQQGVYAYFPSSRSEVPYWLNSETAFETALSMQPTFSKRLRHKIYVEKALHGVIEWLFSLLTDSRIHVVMNAEGKMQANSQGSMLSLLSMHRLETCNKILRMLLNDEEARFSWEGRHYGQRIAIANNSGRVLPDLFSLSTGQAILLGMFGTILRYGDSASIASSPEQMTGICIIDEIDAHLHVDLQHSVLPRLIKLFPGIQFILSTHSPLFVLGMEREFGAEALQVVEMPHGQPVTAESYSEFGRAMDALAATKEFDRRLADFMKTGGKPLVLTEGITDPAYLLRAAELLGNSTVLADCDIHWIGSKNDGGQVFHTGKDAMKHTRQLLLANPEFSNRRVLLLYDNDVGTTVGDFGNHSVRVMSRNTANRKVKAGIENLLPAKLIKAEYFKKTERLQDNGNSVISKELDKTRLCNDVVKSATAAEFAAFAPTMQLIEDFLTSKS